MPENKCYHAYLALTFFIIIYIFSRNDYIQAKTYGYKYEPKQFSIFATTINWGEASLQEIFHNMGDWIPKYHDIYALGFQECIELAGLRELVLNYIQVMYNIISCI